MRSAAPIERVAARAFTVPLDATEADGTLAWDSTTLVLAEVTAAGRTGLGYSYTHAAAREIIRDPLAGVLTRQDAFATTRLWDAMRVKVRNFGHQGICAAAISALDVALWDLKARLLEVPLAVLMGPAREACAIYGSGGFIGMTLEAMQAQLGGWVSDAGCSWVKMKVGDDADLAVTRMRAARAAIGDAELMIDANGACTRKGALQLARLAQDHGVTWFEEPVPSDDLAGLRLLRDRTALEIAAGEYGYDLLHFRRLLRAEAVDVVQADATRCLGYTGFLRAAALADAHGVPLSAHTAPALHLPVCCAAPRLRHIEWFHDHVRLEAMLFDGAPLPSEGLIRPDLSRPGHGLQLRAADAQRFEV
ncbi:enolase C-terminal domain-like protein [Falsiroseomonas sp.]|uniref:enolase C-terminal domain-like protein n=1 Tax=Falsiroseomonas sp. TaxID=2870721 RepID=UPI0035661F11